MAIGSNCNKEVLEGRRNVKPRQSKPCRIEGYTLAFSHRGLPYWRAACSRLMWFLKARASVPRPQHLCRSMP